LEELRALVRDVRGTLSELGGDLPAQAVDLLLDSFDPAQRLLAAHFAYTSHQWRTGSSSQSQGCTAAVTLRRKRAMRRSVLRTIVMVIRVPPVVRPPGPAPLRDGCTRAAAACRS